MFKIPECVCVCISSYPLQNIEQLQYLIKKTYVTFLSENHLELTVVNIRILHSGLQLLTDGSSLIL